MTTKHKTPILTIRAKGPATTGGRIPLADLISLCENVQLALERVARVLHGETDSRKVGRKPREIALTCPLEVIALNRGSFEVGFDLPPDTFESMHTGYEALERLVDGISVINRDAKASPDEYDAGVKESLTEVGRILGKGIRSVELVAKIGKKKKHRAIYSRKTLNRLQAQIQQTVTKAGSIEGELLMIDFGKRTEVCRIHPSLGDPVTCYFDSTLEDRIQPLLKRLVRVHGVVTSDAASDQPKSIRVTDIEPLRLPGEPATMGDEFWQEKSLERLAEEQQVKAIQEVDEVFGAGKDLWTDDEEFSEFLAGLARKQG